MGLTTNLQIGQSGMLAAQAGLQVTAQNVANSTVEGASRRTLITNVAEPVDAGGAQFGRGVEVVGISTSVDRFLEARRIAAAGVEARGDLTYSQLRSAERIFDTSEGQTTKDRLEALFDSLVRATSEPGDIAYRRGVVLAAQDFATSVNRDARTLLNTNGDIAEELVSSVPAINERLKAIAEINGLVNSTDNGVQSINGDFYDRRSTLLKEVGEMTGATIDIDKDGFASVFIGGHAAVARENYRELSAVYDAITDTESIRLATSDISTTNYIDVTQDVGGEMGGRVDSRRVLKSVIGDLNTFAEDLGTAFNTQHAAGFDSTGTAGGTLFNFTAGAAASTINVDAAIANDTNLLAFAGAATGDPGDTTNLEAMIAIEDAVTVAGTRTAGGYFAFLTSNLGIAVRRAEQQAATGSLEARELEEVQQSTHGIDLDEEATNLILYQTAYQAATKIVATTDELIQSLINLV